MSHRHSYIGLVFSSGFLDSFIIKNNFVFIFRCSSSPINPVYVRDVDSSDFVSSHSSHRHSEIGFYLQLSLSWFMTNIIYSVYDSRDRSSEVELFELFSNPPSSVTHLHNIQTPTLPTPPLLRFTFTQVLWFLSCLTRPRASDVTTRPAVSLSIISTRGTKCHWVRYARRLDPTFLLFSLSLHRHPFTYILFSLTLALPLIINNSLPI